MNSQFSELALAIWILVQAWAFATQDGFSTKEPGVAIPIATPGIVMTVHPTPEWVVDPNHRLEQRITACVIILSRAINTLVLIPFS